MTDTPISDSTDHNVAELGMLCRRLERELNAANAEIERLTNKVAQLYEGAEEAKQRIKRLEEAGDAIIWVFCTASVSIRNDRESEALKLWIKAREVKP